MPERHRTKRAKRESLARRIIAAFQTSECSTPLADGRPIRLEFAVLTKTKSPEIVRHRIIPWPQQIARTKRIVERAWSGIESRLFYPSPSPLNCPTCPFRRQCDAWGA